MQICEQVFFILSSGIQAAAFFVFLFSFRLLLSFDMNHNNEVSFYFVYSLLSVSSIKNIIVLDFLQ